MSLERLLQIPEAAKMLGVPVESLRRAADHHGKTIRMGRAVRLHPDDLEELVELCRVEPKAPASTGGKGRTAPQPGKSETAPSASARALQSAAKLKKPSPPTSTRSSGQLVQLDPRN